MARHRTFRRGAAGIVGSVGPILEQGLAEALIADLDASVEAAAAGSGPRLASATVRVDGEVDPPAVAFSTKLASDRWFCWEQPHSDGFALAAVGAVAEVRSRGADRFADAAARATALLDGAERPDLPAGAGPLLVGGFGFWDEAAASGKWSSFPPALLTLPELSLARIDGAGYLTVNAYVRSPADAESARARARARVAALAHAQPLPLLDPPLIGECRVESVLAPEWYEQAVAEACRRMRDGALRKVVLAREVVVEAPRAHSAAAIFRGLRESYRSCYCFSVGTPEAAFTGASPELLARRRGAGVWTVALAASTRRSSDPSIDRLLGQQLASDPKTREEHEIVAERIVAKLRKRAVWVQRTPEPEVVKVANIQHLATPIHAQLREPLSPIELAGMLHPTPALGGEPWELAAPALREIEPMERGWYGSPIGWLDASQDGEFCVGIRSALLRDRQAHLFAGNGIVAASDPRAELAETEIKLQVLLPLVTS
jgi:salicylate biosynthesis isochorismate synthase/menaquinone-specific isochorismate synthase